VISIEQRGVAFVLSSLVAAIIVPPTVHLSLIAGIFALGGALALQLPLAHVVPAGISGASRRRPIVCAAWLLLSVVAITLTGRLSVFMTDVTRTWAAPIPDPAAINHQCLGAYVRAADLARQHVPNLYAAEFYPAYAGACGVPSKAVAVRGLGKWVVDPYLYPPHFLVVPRLALFVTDNFDTIRTLWFVCQSLFFLGAALALTRWLPTSAALIWLLLIPAILASPPTMLNLQFGQFHVVAMILACAAMVLFEIGWSVTGGALLAFAILSKISPGILLIALAAQRRWRDLAWTAAGFAGFTLIGILVLGIAPFSAFIGYEVPRLISGDAFSFVDLPSQSVFVTSRNFSITGIGARLRLLGLATPTHAQLMILAWLFTLVVLWLAIQLRTDGTRASRLTRSLGLLNLAALRAQAAPSAYVVVPALWMLALLASESRGRRWWPFVIASAWVVIVGPPPLPDRIDLIASGIGQAAMVGTCLWVSAR
jgi:hypothetical protein